MAQKDKEVKNELIAYTSDSTALNQKLSMNVLVKAATKPAPIINKARFSLSSLTILSAKWVVIQKVNITQPALAAPLSMLIQKPTAVTSLPASKENNRPTIKNKGAPGG